MKLNKILLLSTLAFLMFSCVSNSSFVTKSKDGNLEINLIGKTVITQYSRVYIDNIFIGNLSSTKPTLILNKGYRKIKIVTDGYKTIEETIYIIGETGHQVINIPLTK